MNKDTLKGQWHQAKGMVKKKWGKLTDDDLDKIDGDTERLVGKVQENYGLAREEAEKQVDEWMKSNEVQKTS
ncbi:MAG: CsbD family protein [Phycisphaerae bacterium]